MPKLIKSKTEQQDCVARGLLKNAQGQYSLGPGQLAAVLGCSERTFRSRYNTPATLTLAEIRRLIRGGYVKKEDVLRII
mgnify:CR=1 FL=1